MNKLLKTNEGVLILVIIAMCALFTMGTGKFLSIGNFYSILEGQIINLVFALGLLIVLISGGIDISFLAIASISQYVMAYTLTHYGLNGIPSIIIGVIIAILTGVILGTLNALAINYLKLSTIIVTISSGSLFFGLLMYFTGGTSIFDLPDWLGDAPNIASFVVNKVYIDITVPIVGAVILAIACHLLLNKVSIARYIFALGDNEESARRIGININKLKIIIYASMGAISAFAGIMQTIRVQEVVPNSLYGNELDILAGVVIGGASLEGGKGSVLGTILGLVLIAIIKNGLALLGVPSYFNKLIIGFVILVTIIAVGLRTRKKLI